MILKELRRQFERDLVRAGTAGEGILSAGLPEETLSRWQTRFDGCGIEPTSLGGRYRNSFLIGSDPEFAITADGRRKSNAYELGLKVGLAAGCDQNERLVELRPAPSNSVVEHLAGVLCTLRWMYRAYPSLRPLAWICPPFFDGDGIGGHVHFGRKRPTRELEVQALDRLALVFIRAGIFNGPSWHRRMQGDSRHQLYGRLSDTRSQYHGYEYRSFPSWLDSPAKAFVVLAASKLAVCDPDLVMGWLDTIDGDPLLKLTRLARYHRGRDDDAWVLYNFLKRGQELALWRDLSSQDFKPAWGLGGSDPCSIHIFPNMIEPVTEDKQDMQAYLVDNVHLPMRLCSPNFAHSIPDGYTWLPSAIHPDRRPGVGDFIHDLVTTGDRDMFNFHFAAAMDTGFSTRAWSLLTRDEKTLARSIGLDVSTRTGIELRLTPNFLRDADNARTLKRLLLGAKLPLWTVKTVERNSYKEWKTAADKTKLDEGRFI